MTKRTAVVSFFLLTIPALVLSLYAYLGFFSRLMADDFCTFNDAQRFKTLRFIWHWFNNWGGRYSAIATDELLDTIGATGVRYVPLVVLLIWTVISSLMCRELLQKTFLTRMHPLLSSALGVGIVFTVISLSPGITKVLFWWNGMRTYIPPLISFTFHAAFLCWAMGGLKTKRQVWFGILASFIIALFSGGYNETFTLVQFMVFSASTGLFMLNKKTHSKSGLFLLLAGAATGAALALTIMLISPGAALRRDIFVSQPLDIMNILKITAVGYFDYLTQMLGNINKFTALIGLIFTTIWVGAQSGEKLANKWLVVLPVAGGVLISFASLIPSAYGLGQMPALRTFTVPTFTLVLSLGYGGLLLGKWISTAADSTALYRITTILMLCAVSFISVSSWLNAMTLYADRGIYMEYASQWDSIDTQIKQAISDGAESVTIPATNNWARLDQPNQNPKYWATRCYSDFYGIQVYGPPSGP